MLHGAIDLLMAYIYWGYHQMRFIEHDTHRSTSRPHFRILVMSLGLTNMLVTSQSHMQWNIYLLLLHNKAWEVHLRQLDEVGGILDTMGIFQLDTRSNTHNAQVRLDWFTWIAANKVGNGIVSYRYFPCACLESSLRENSMRVMQD